VKTDHDRHSGESGPPDKALLSLAAIRPPSKKPPAIPIRNRMFRPFDTLTSYNPVTVRSPERRHRTFLADAFRIERQT
jgi:hypothetical protein